MAVDPARRALLDERFGPLNKVGQERRRRPGGVPCGAVIRSLQARRDLEQQRRMGK